MNSIIRNSFKFKNLSFLIGAFLITLAFITVFTPVNAGHAYQDVDDNNTFISDISFLSDEGIFKDTDCEVGFCPNKPLTRWQMAVWLIRVFDGEDPQPIKEARFVDVEANQFYAPFVERLAELKITTGCSKEPAKYCPNDIVPRRQMASFIARAFELPQADIAGFKDVAPTNTHAKDIDRLYASQITTGCSKNPLLYCPNNFVTKGQMAAFLSRGIRWANNNQSFEVPINVHVAAKGIGAQVSWSQSLIKKDSIENYTVAWRVKNALEWSASNLLDNSVKSYTIENLSANEVYEVAVNIINKDSTITRSMLKQIRAPSIPGAPSNLQYVRNQESIELSWTASVFDGRSPVKAYLIQWKLADQSWADSSSLEVTTTSANITLSDDSAYEVLVRAINSVGAGTASIVKTINPPTPPSKPRNARIELSSSDRYYIHWDAPVDEELPGRYIVQWRFIGEDYHQQRQKIITPTNNQTQFSFKLPKTYMARVQSVNQEGLNSSEELFIDSTENKIRNIIKTKVMDVYSNDHPWLKEVEPYINQPDFSFVKNSEGAYFRGHSKFFSKNPINTIKVVEIEAYAFPNGELGTDIHHIQAYLHELAHVWTLTNGISKNPAPIAIAHLYFSKIINESGNLSQRCIANELLADALTTLVDPNHYNPYWKNCVINNNTYPTAEALEIVESASNGEIPAWFYDEYQKDDGSLDLETIWADIQDLGKNHNNLGGALQSRQGVIYQLKDSFGGYCSPAKKANVSIWGHKTTVVNPWRDGGCESY